MAVDPSLGCQDIQYSQSSEYPQSHGQHSTYDSLLPLSVQGACSTSRRISLQNLQDRAKMRSKDHSAVTMEQSISSASRLSLGVIKRSVPGMKTLLSLKLLSPTLPKFDTWPSPEPPKRSTFGTRIVLQDLEDFSSIGDRARDSLRSPKRSQQYRDTPIYSEPGSPIPSRAYLSEDDVSFKYSQPESICEADRVIQDLINLRDSDTARYDPEEDAVPTPSTIKNISQRPEALSTPRWSQLSFQCSGEAWYENESVWLRSPISKGNSAVDCITADDERINHFTERTVESWLSDTSSTFEHEDEILACATALSPSKAQVIDLKVNPNYASNLSLRIPARSSSLMGRAVPNNNFWETCGTPPITPAGPWDRDSDLILDDPHIYHDKSVLPKRRLDHALEIPSPPLSPDRKRIHYSGQDLDNQWPLSSNFSQPLLTDIIGGLEALTSNFPSSILLPDSPCVSAIRSRNMQPSSPLSMNPIHIPTTPLQSPFGQDFPHPPSYQPSGKPKTADFSSRRQNFSFSKASSHPQFRTPLAPRSSSLPIPTSPSHIDQPDLSPLHRIFPKTSDFMRSALYAHIVAHSFVTSLSASMQSAPKAQTNRFSGRRRDTPHWTASPFSTKAANLLGIPSQDSDPSDESAEKQLQFKLRIEALQQTLRKCIYCLISVMDSNLGIDDIAELDDCGPGLSNGKLFIRTLDEVIRSCEGSSMV